MAIMGDADSIRHYEIYRCFVVGALSRSLLGNRILLVTLLPSDTSIAMHGVAIIKLVAHDI